MSCPVREQIRQDVNRIGKIAKEGHTNATIVQPGVVEFQANLRYNTRSALYGQAQKSIKAVKEWANEKYGKDYQDLWLEAIYQPNNNYIRVAFKFPSRLEKVLLVEQEELSIEEANAEMRKNIGADFFMGDFLLEEQQQREFDQLDITDEEIEILKTRKPDC